MSPLGRSFTVTVLGPVSIWSGNEPGTLSTAKQRTVAALVAGGSSGVTLEDLALLNGGADRPQSPAAVRMSVARVRDLLPPGTLPDAVAGRYQLKLPAAAVDAWRLAEVASGSIHEVTPEELCHLLSPAEPYAGLAETDLIDRSRREIQARQRDVLERLSREGPEILSGPFRDLLLGHLEQHPYNERLVDLTARSHALSGDRREALNILRAARKRFIEAGLDLSTDLDQLEQQLLEGRAVAGMVWASGPTAALPPALTDARKGRYVGSREALDCVARLLDNSSGPSCALILGRAGIGKTRLCAELAAEAVERAIPVLYLAPSTKPGVGFGPLLAALPELGPKANLILSSSLDSGLRKAGLWAAAHEAIAARASDGAILIVVDDAQRLDSQTAELVAHLAQSRLAGRLVLVVAGREDGGEAEDEWLSLTTALCRSASVVEIELRPLDNVALRDLVRSQAPDIGEHLVYRLAEELLVASGGLPGVARLALANLDETDLRPNLDSLSSDRLLSSVVERLSADARRIGVIGSLIGPEFDVVAAQHISGLTEDEVLEAIDELVRRQLVVELSAVDFSIAHVLVQATLAASELQARKYTFHVAAAAYFASDVHRRARHLAEAVPRVPAVAAVSALLESAQSHLEQGLYWEAVRAIRRAKVLSGQPLDPLVNGYLARALDLSGMRNAARRVRREAFGAALATADQGRALRIATSGLPEAEPVDGDPELVTSLLALDPRQLGRAEAFDHACHLARQLAITGRVDEARQHGERARELARTREEHVRAAVTRRFTISATSAPESRIALLIGVADQADVLDPSSRAELLVLMALDLYEGGRRHRAEKAREEIDRIAGPPPPVRRWHALLFDAMIRTDDGDLLAAAARRADALDCALRFGIGEAEHAHQGAELLARRITRTGTGEVWLQASEPDNGDITFLDQASLARLLMVEGRTTEAVSASEHVAANVLRSPVSQGTVALAMVSRPLARSKDQDLIRASRAMLESRGNSMLVVGAFVASIGPVARYVANLVPVAAERLDFLHAARELADRSGSLLWRAHARRDLARAGDRASRRELSELVAGTALAGLDLPRA